MTGQIYVISGPSGAGKSTIIGILRSRIPGLGYSISHTSRPPRGDEKDGEHYHFVDRETFTRLIEEAAFVEWARVYGDLYGTSFRSLRIQLEQGLDVILDVDSQGAENIREHFPDSILIYILPPSLEALERRLNARGTDEQAVVRARVEKAFEDIRNCVRYDYIVFNEDLEAAVDEVRAVVVAGRCRRRRRLPAARDVFPIP
ncbi:MAG: guanylate kinase [Deltaproteobacteria bacterium]|nr:guanylate kinase [Deltaproteobacteria bacterium]